MCYFPIKFQCQSRQNSYYVTFVFLFFYGRLGATPVMELMIASGKAVPKLQLEHGLAVDRVYTGSFMTSLDMAGLFSDTC